METKMQAYYRREREREALTRELTAGNREINKNLNEISGWAKRTMEAVLAPMGDEGKSILSSIGNQKGGTPFKREQ